MHQVLPLSHMMELKPIANVMAVSERVGTKACTPLPVLQTWHWNEKRYIAQYYADLAKKEAKEEADRQAAIKAKFAELERRLS